MAFNVTEAEALQLEEFEQRAFRRARTRHAFKGIPKQKLAKYADIRNKMRVDEFNDTQKRDKLVSAIYKRNSKDRSLADAIVRGDDPV